ncbi:MAG: Ig-like domain-containing protein, partial [Thermodesulfobacteriota bacterium]
MSTSNRLRQGVSFLIAAVFCIMGFWTTSAVAAETFCASVKIEIRQQLSLERQAFDAHMRINNGLSNMDLTDLNVTITFTDKEGNPVIATTNPNDNRNYPEVGFFIRKDSDNIAAIDSEGSWEINDVVASSSSDLHWLIIPVPGSAGDQPDGKLYYVGAKLSYRMGTGGDEQVVNVTPDYIYVKPLPDLTLDYFLTRQVYGDDPLTSGVEPSVPFTLGVRAKNTGNNSAYRLKIDSAQPTIIENSQDLLIGFSIIASEVNGVTTDNSLLVELGDVAPGKAAVGRWQMICSLAGEFTEFNASVSHADGLGGQVTSIISGINTLSLAKDVLVDLPGRDSVADFLARDIEAPYAITKVCESEAVGETWDTDVVTYVATAVQSGGLYKIDFTPSGAPGEFIYCKVTDPFDGQKAISEVIRSDGKRVKAQNAWLSKERTDPDHPEAGWSYYVNLFDVNTTGRYDVALGNAAGNQPPSFVPALSKTGVEGQELIFEVRATDPEGDTLQLSLSNLPDGANFTDNGDGSGTFCWTPSAGQAGSYMLSFRASDGELITMQIVPVTISAGNDSDGDGMDDNWELEHFGNLDRDGSGDFDGDGISDLDEYVNDTDPTREDYGPSAPAIASPGDGQETSALSPTLEIDNSTDPDGDSLTYDFEVFSDPQFTSQVAAGQNVAETADQTAWIVSGTLNDNTLYYWRVRAFDGVGYSLWTYGAFFVNTANDAPGAFHISRPAAGSFVDTTTPVLEVTNSTDIDRDVLTYNFEVFADADLTTAVTSTASIPRGAGGATAWTVDTALVDGNQYYWRAIAVDPHGGQTATATGSFTVLLSNQAPTSPAISVPTDGATVTANSLDIIVSSAEDADSDPLVYDFQMDIVDTFDGPGLVTAEGVVGDVWTIAWYVTDLAGNTTYYWRARAFDGQAYGPWVTGRFFVNPVNEAPLAPTLKNPGENAWVNTLTPELSVHPAVDPDGDNLTYYFEVYADSTLETLVYSGTSSQPSLVVPSGLNDNTRYYWRAMAEDPAGEISGWTAAATFFIKQYASAPDELTVNVTANAGDPLSNVPVYAFSASGTYTGLNTITDADGV